MNNAQDNPFRSEQALKRLRRRRNADTRFQAYGILALCFALSALVFLISAIAWKASGAATYHVIRAEIQLSSARIVPDGNASAEEITRNIEGFYSLVRDDLIARFPEATQTGQSRQAFSGLVDRMAVLPLARRVAENPHLIGRTVTAEIPLSDDVDMFLKGAAPRAIFLKLGSASSSTELAQSAAFRLQVEQFRKVAAKTKALALDGESPTVLLMAGSSVATIESFEGDTVTLSLLTGTSVDFDGAPVRAILIPSPETQRSVSDQQIAWALALKAEGAVRRVPHTSLLTHTDSTYTELAGSLAALVGSLLTMLVTACVSIPMGIFAAIFLEEFAPKNRLTQIIEVNINNLAAVPSIVFGLLGATLLLGTFGLPRSAPLVGGLVLALLILPVVIIAARAALRAVPPSIRSGALAVGASRMQAVFHHVLPLALPGMLTGAILGMARALGETAPLLLIGMVAFVAEVPSSTTDEATALPVLIYSWASNAERAWEPMTAAVIIILLGILIVMNLAVVLLRRKFERRW